MLEKINGIIIKTRDYGESNKIVTIYSKKIGVFSALARGAKKPKSRMAAVVQPFIYAQFFVYVNRGLSTIQQGEIIDSYRVIREDIVKTAYAAYIGELSDKLIEQKVQVPYLFEQFSLTLNWIRDHEEVRIPVMMYEMKLYEQSGILPVINRCVNCDSKSAPFHFSVSEGGLLCSQCARLDEYAISLTNTLVRLLFTFAKTGLDQINSISVKEENIVLLRKLLDDYYDKYGGHYLKSRRFLTQLDKLK